MNILKKLGHPFGCALLCGGIFLFFPAGARAEISIAGAYSNKVVTDKQARGYSIQLWREGERYFGIFLCAAGLAEDVPVGVLDALRYDRNTHALIFRAKLSIGKATFDGETWEPTRDLYQFEGTLFPDQISGSLNRVDMLQPKHPATQETVTLYRSKEEEAAMLTPAGYAEWSEWAQKRLASHGPKW